MLMEESIAAAMDHSELHLVNDLAQLPLMTQWVEEIGERAQLAPGELFNLTLAIEEVVVNVMNYAYGDRTGMPVDLKADFTASGLVVTLIDHGMPFDPTAAQEPDLDLPVEERPIGGLGIMLVNKLTRRVEYARQDDMNVLTLYF